jgi:excisionase family DNA binding protein
VNEVCGPSSGARSAFGEAPPATPSPWMNVKQAASYARCHEETIRRGYLAGFLKATRFGQRGRRIHVADLECWMRDGARTR